MSPRTKAAEWIFVLSLFALIALMIADVALAVPLAMMVVALALFLVSISADRRTSVR